MKKSRLDRNEMGFQSRSAIATPDELIFNLFKFGAMALIATFLWFILLMGGVH